MFKRHGFKRLAATALASLAVAGMICAGAAFAQEAPQPAAAAKPDTAAAKPAATPAATPAAAPARPAKAAYTDRKAIDGPWTEDANWLSFMAGYARAGGANAGDAMGGYGMGFTHMINTKWSFGAQIRHELLGHIGNSYEMSVPMTAEFCRHFKTSTVVRPYGMGGGYYFHKYYRTASDYTGSPGGGWHMSFGVNLPVDDRHVLGLDARVGFVAGRGENVVNPVFGPESDTMSQWSIKAVWAIVP